MLKGRFGDTTGRPYLEGRLIFPQLGLSGDISFLVDTGADKSLIMPADSARLSIDFTALSNTSAAMGVGGTAEIFVEDGILIFAEDETRLVAYLRQISIAPYEPSMLPAPSLLGRDVIDCWRMTYDKPAGLLSFEVLNADATIPIQ